MGIENNRHDDALDKVLAALREAVPPEGMEARIALRLQQHPQPAPASHWRDRLAAGTLAGAWWRGAIGGASAAMLATAMLLFASHLMRVRADRTQTTLKQDATVRNVAPRATPVSAATQRTPADDEPRTRPCASPNVLRVPSDAPTLSGEKLLAQSRAESTAPSHPAPELPLTPQERGLVRLAKTGDPTQLATLSSETQAKVTAEEAAEFARFFAPPSPPTPDVNSEANPDTKQKASPEVGPAVNE